MLFLDEWRFLSPSSSFSLTSSIRSITLSKAYFFFQIVFIIFFIANVIHGKMAPLVYFMSLFIDIFNAINIPHITSNYTSPVQHIIFEVFISMLQYGANAPKISNDDIDITIRWQLTNNKKVTTNTPKAEGLTAIEAWMLSCILFVFGALVGKELFL